MLSWCQDLRVRCEKHCGCEKKKTVFVTTTSFTSTKFVEVHNG